MARRSRTIRLEKAETTLRWDMVSNYAIQYLAEQCYVLEKKLENCREALRDPDIH